MVMALEGMMWKGFPCGNIVTENTPKEKFSSLGRTKLPDALPPLKSLLRLFVRYETEVAILWVIYSILN